ncbi:protein-tyrosine phosphatase family protein [Variovorax sp. RHLX14]|uniref:protein-tyrosine phosphatase family protein n=1 Tax=Variovorax sp. RHLX14 TaxID=1259731 RepID=UPI003F46D39C
MLFDNPSDTTEMDSVTSKSGIARAQTGHRLPAAKEVDSVRDARANNSLGNNAMQRVLAPLNPYERQKANQLARTLAPTHRASARFNASTPSHAVGPYSGTQYTFTCCPTEHGAPGTGNFKLDDMLDSAFRSGTTTTMSLTNEGDARHSTYYKRSQTTPSGKYTVASHGTPEYTTMVNERGRPVTGSIFKNTVRNNQTGQIQQMKMIHVNGWPDQTAIEAKNELKILSDVSANLGPNDMKKVLIHCTAGRNRTCSATSIFEMANAASKGMKPNVDGVLGWFRQARVADAAGIPSQLQALAESSIRLGRLAKPSGAGFVR